MLLKNNIFRRFADNVSHLAGTAYVFTLALSLIIIWILTGPLFNFSNTWQLFINTLTTIITFLMVFIIQNTQNREAKATQLKLDELVRAVKGARNSFVDIENIADDELDKIQQEFEDLHERYKKELERRKQKK